MWKLKLTDDGKPVFGEGGLPVYIGTDGKEISFDAERAYNKITELNTEARTWREKAEGAQKVVSELGDLSPAEAKKAMQALEALKGDQKKFDETMNRVKKELNDAWEAKHKALESERDGFKARFESNVMTAAFRSSKVLTKERVVPPVSLLEAQFRNSFKIEGDKLIGQMNGQPIYSRANPGNVAEFDEALEILIDSHPDRNDIWRASQKPGVGKQTDGKGGTGGDKVATRDQYEKWNPQEKANFFAGGGTLTD